MKDNGDVAAAPGWIMALFGLVLSCMIAWGIGFLQARDNEHRHHRPQAYQEGAEASAKRACKGLEADAMLACVYDRVAANHETALVEQDLSAQQRAATSALLTAIIGIIALVVTAIGVWFVKRTLDATLEAVKDTSEATAAMKGANEIAIAAQRPWISLGVDITDIRVAGGALSVTFSAGCTNIGKMLARDFRCTVNCIAMGHDAQKIIEKSQVEWRSKSGPERSSVLVPGDQAKFGGTIHPHSTLVPWFGVGAIKYCYLVILVDAAYRFGDSDEVRYSQRAFAVSPANADILHWYQLPNVNRNTIAGLSVRRFGPSFAS